MYNISTSFRAKLTLRHAYSVRIPGIVKPRAEEEFGFWNFCQRLVQLASQLALNVQFKGGFTTMLDI